MQKVKIVVEFAPDLVTTRHAVVNKEEIIKAIETMLERSKRFRKSEYSVYFTWR